VRRSGVGLIVATVLAAAYWAVSLWLVEHSAAPRTYAAVDTGAELATAAAGTTLILAGLLAWWDQPSSAVGPITTGLGVVWWAPVWVGWDGGVPAARSVAMLVAPCLPALLLHLAAVFPTGHLRRGIARVPVMAAYLATAAYTVTRALVRDPFRDLHCWSNCRDNVFLIAPNPGLARALDPWWSAFAVLVGLAVVGIALGRLGVATPVGRRLLWPVLVPVALAGVGELLYAGLLLTDPAESPTDPLFRRVFLLRAVSLTLVGVGTGWTVARDWAARRAVVRLSAELMGAPGPGTLRDALAQALGDPKLEVAYWLPESARHVDSDGRTTPATAPGRASTPIVRDGRPVAVVLHDRDLQGARDLESRIGAAARLAVDNERLRAGVLAQVRDVQASRVRIIEASDTARRLLERDLHDSAQQRLLALTYELRLARADAQSRGHAERAHLLAAALHEAQAVVADLRDLAHGIYPAILTEAGLGPALWSLADQAPLPVEVIDVPDQRPDGPVERAVYLAVARAIAQATRTHADHLKVSVAVAAGTLHLRVTPVSDPTDADIVDRIGALGGHVGVTQGILHGEVPCA
jgi:signal transduction histidine kinase